MAKNKINLCIFWRVRKICFKEECIPRVTKRKLKNNDNLSN